MGQNPWLSKVNECLQLPDNKKYLKSPIEGRPPDEFFGHQEHLKYLPKHYFQSAIAGARRNTGLRHSRQRHGFDPATEFGPDGLYGGGYINTEVRLHPMLPIQKPNSVWTYDGTLPPKLLVANYGHPLLFRQYNALPIGPDNQGFGAAHDDHPLPQRAQPRRERRFSGRLFLPRAIL